MAQKYFQAVFDKAKQVRGNHLVVLLTLADFANERGECWPYPAVLADRAHLTERRTREIIKDLQARGYISVYVPDDANVSRRYTINLDALTQQEQHA